MLAAAHGRGGNRHVPLVGCPDEDRIDLHIAAQLLAVGIKFDRARQFDRKAAHPILGQVAERDDYATRALFE